MIKDLLAIGSHPYKRMGFVSLLTFPPPMIFSAAYTDLPQRGHLSTSTIFLANFEALVGVEGRAGFGDPLQQNFYNCLKMLPSLEKGFDDFLVRH